MYGSCISIKSQLLPSGLLIELRWAFCDLLRVSCSICSLFNGGSCSKVMQEIVDWYCVKLRFWMEMSGLKSCEALASTCRLRRSLDGCLKFRRSGRSRRVQSRAEKKLKKGESELVEVGC